MTEGELKKHLEAAEKSPKQIAAAVSGLPEKVLRYKPAPEKWCIQEILGHLADIEIVYAYRLRQMLADKKPVIAPDGPGRLGAESRLSGDSARRIGRALRTESPCATCDCCGASSRRTLASRHTILRRSRTSRWRS